MTSRREFRSTWWAWVVLSLRQAAWAPILVFVIHVTAIFCFDLYSLLPEFDIPMHVVGGIAIAYFWTACLRAAARLELHGAPSPLVFPPLVLGLTSLAAVVWEFAEFVADRQFGWQTQSGLPDTLLDLLMGLLGGAVWIGWSHCRSATTKGPPRA